MNGVSQDSGKLKQIAEYIDGEAIKFQQTYNALFDEVAKQLTESQSDASAWWGPQALAFLEAFNAKKTDFENAMKNITSMSQNLSDQANAWEAFENAG